MISKVEMVYHVNYVEFLFAVLLPQLVQNFNLYHSLLVEARLIANNFDGDHFTTFMIHCFYHGAKRTLKYTFSKFSTISLETFPIISSTS